jgi:trk system potassium uptake protein TrkA
VKAVIVGCGRVGSVLADAFDRAGQDVIIIDTSTSAFDRLPSSFGGQAVRGDGTDEDTLRRAGAESADLFMAMTEGDNRNVMAAQLAVEALDARRVIAKINDPLRAAAYADLGINTLCRTNLMAAAVNDFLGLDLVFGPGMAEATGFHPGGEHHAEGAEPGDPGNPPASAAGGDGETPAAAGPPVADGAGLTSAPGASTGSSAAPLSNQAPATPVAAREA